MSTLLTTVGDVPSAVSKVPYESTYLLSEEAGEWCVNFISGRSERRVDAISTKDHVLKF